MLYGSINFLNNYLNPTQCMDMKKTALETLIAQTHDRYAQCHADALEQITVFRDPQHIARYAMWMKKA